MNVGKRITEYRQARGWTVNRLANMAGISQSYLRELELGNKQPTVEYLGYVCDALGVTLAEFFTEETAASPLEQALRAMTPEQQEALLRFIHAMRE